MVQPTDTRYIVLSLDFSMHCRDDEYPISNSFVSIHTVTESEEKAQGIYDTIYKEFALHNETHPQHQKKVIITKVSDEFTSIQGVTALWLRMMHDTLQSA